MTWKFIIWMLRDGALPTKYRCVLFLFILIKYIKYINKIYNIDKIYIIGTCSFVFWRINREQITDLLGINEFTEKASENHLHRTDATGQGCVIFRENVQSEEGI